MINVCYVSSGGKSYDLLGDKMRVTDGNLHKYKWQKNSEKANNRERLVKFTKESTNYQLTLTLRGDLEERKTMLNSLIDSFEQDVATGIPGKIYFGEYYIDCFIISAESKASEIRSCWSECLIEIYCPSQFWIKEEKHEFKKDFPRKDIGYLDFPFDFPFDLMGDEKGVGSVLLDNYSACDFILTIYGPCTNPRIVIGGNVYEVKTKLDDGEYLLINSKEGTVVRVRTNGIKVDEFDNRVTNPNSPFEKIQTGYNLVSWDGSFGFDILILIKRSVPRWKKGL